MGKNAGILTAVAIVIVCGVIGCAPAAPAPVHTATVKPVPSPTAEPITAPGPTPRLNSSCDELVPSAAVDTALAADVSLRPTGFSAHQDGPVEFAAQQFGALRCVWANGDRKPEWVSGGLSEFRGALLTVVPDGAEPWGVYSHTYSNSESVPSPYGVNALGPNCVPDLGECFFQALVGTNWVDLSLIAVGGVGRTGSGTVPEQDKLGETEMNELVAPVIESVLQTLATEPPARPVWQVPASVGALPSDCEQFLQPAQAEESSGVAPLQVSVNWDGPKVGQSSFSRAKTGAERCHINLRDSDSGIGSLDYLPGGGWAFDRLSALWLANGTAVQTPLAGLSGDDAAITRCAVLDDTCSVDLRIDGNWVQLNITAYAPDYIYTADGVDVRIARDHIGELAAAVVANLKGAAS